MTQMCSSSCLAGRSAPDGRIGGESAMDRWRPVSGVTAQEADQLFTPPVPNPNK
jgi:hypothetical protein